MFSPSVKDWLRMFLIPLMIASLAQAQPDAFVWKDAPGPTHDGSTWGFAYLELRDALASASADEEIWVAKGTYLPDDPSGGLNRDATFAIPDGLRLYGGFVGNETTLGQRNPDPATNDTLLSGDPSNNDDTATPSTFNTNTRIIITGPSGNQFAIVDGFTITGASLHAIVCGTNCDMQLANLLVVQNFAESPFFGAGLYNINSSSPSITNCTFEDNIAGNRGGAIFCQGSGSEPSIEDCVFRANKACEPGGGQGSCQRGGAIVATEGAKLTILDSQFFLNKAHYGGAIYCGENGDLDGDDSSALVVRCLFANNETDGGGGGAIWDHAEPADVTTPRLEVLDSVFVENIAKRGGAIYGSKLFVVRSDFIRNGAILHSDGTRPGQNEGGGAIAVDPDAVTSTVDLESVNNRFFANVSQFGGAVWQRTTSSASSGLYVNCVFDGNQATGYSAGGSGVGGAVKWEGASIGGGNPGTEMFNCTFFSNGARDDVGGFHRVSGPATPILRNCVFWCNHAGGAVTEATQLNSGVDIENSLIEDLNTYAGDGNIGDDPLFVSAAGADTVAGTIDDDLRLTDSSPAIDLGVRPLPDDGGDLDTDAVTAEETPRDLDVKSRAVRFPGRRVQVFCAGAIVDMGAYEYRDCNSNLTDDAEEIAGNSSLDFDTNGVLDQCEDCNTNAVPDGIDISGPTSVDLNGNFIPDECEDCNTNSVLDTVDIAGVTSDDCNNNCFPDECEVEVDCNENDIPDDCDIAAGTAEDCDHTGVIDDCDVIFADCNENLVSDALDVCEGTSDDCNDNGVPDECESGDFDCNTNSVCDGIDIAEGTSEDCNCDEVPDECQTDDCCPGDFNHDEKVDGLDMQSFVNVYIGQGLTGGLTCGPTLCLVDMDEDADIDGNDLILFIDVLLEGTDCGGGGAPRGLSDCNSNSVEDAIDIAIGTSEDCNGNFGPDECDIDGATSADLNTNGVPDECEPDCNGNDVPDDRNIALSTSPDVNSNDVPDECEPDCNTNDIPDDWDISEATSSDCDSNGRPDECDADCNTNGTPDTCDIAEATSPDCNTDGLPDECNLTLTLGPSLDCNTNDVPDQCDIAEDTSEDCNTNGFPDECDIETEISDDVDTNGIPDECEEEFFMMGGGEGGEEGGSDEA